MKTVVVTGSAGLIGSAAARHFAGLGYQIIGIDNDMRRYFFGPDGSTLGRRRAVAAELADAYEHVDADIRDESAIEAVFQRFGDDIDLVVHTAAQPSHDWAAREPLTDFDINARGTLVLLEATRRHAEGATFIFCSTNKVYGDRPNSLPLVELDDRWEIEPGHPYEDGIREDMSIDATLHSVFGASKVAADIMVQEYGRYFGLPTACFRGGTLTGPAHSAAELHGFLGYVMRCAVEGRTYRIYGYKGKQVRDAIHCDDVVAAFAAFHSRPTPGAVYNLGGGRHSNCSVLEALRLAGEIAGRPVDCVYVDEARVGDHTWWIGSNAAFERDHPGWGLTYDIRSILQEIHDENVEHWAAK